MPSSAFKIEQHGIDAVPKAERTKNWWDLFVIQAGVNITLPSFLIGGLLVPGLSWEQAFWALAIGNAVLAILLVLTGFIGVDYGVPTTVASRFSFGYPNGMWLSSLCILLSLVGWFAVTAELAGLAVDGVVNDVTGFSSPTLVIVLVGLSNSIPAIVGFESIKWLSRLSVPGLLALAAWLLVEIVSRNGFSTLVQYQPTNEVAFTTALDWVIGGLIVGVFIAPDISRYVRSRRHNWVGGFLGVLPASAFLGIIGVLSKLSTGDWNPVNAVQTLGLGIPALLIIIFATWTSNDINLYSSGLALTNLVPRLSRWKNTLAVSLLGTALAALRIGQHFEKFLELLTYAFSPLVGVALCDYFLIRKGRVDLREVYQEKGKFFYRKGVNPSAWAAVLIGFLVGIFTPPEFIASMTALFAAGAVYYLAMRISYPKHFE